MRCPELNLPGAILVLPPVRTKNGREHRLPLNPQALMILDERARMYGRSLVFGGGDRGFTDWKRLAARLTASGVTVAPFTLHDLRRSAASGMACLGVALPVIERILNHVSGPSFGGVAGIYQRHSFEAEMRDAMRLWAEHLQRLTA